MTQSLFFEAYKSLNKQKSVFGKQLVLQSIALNDICTDIFMDETMCIDVNIMSTDSLGLDFVLTFKKNKGNIHINFHKKRKMSTFIMFHDTKSFVHDILYSDIHSSIFINSLLSELPNKITEYIYKNYSKKWVEIKNFCMEIMKYEKKNLRLNIHIETTNLKKQLIYKSSK